MNELCPDLCPQSQRALKLLISPDAPKVDRQKLIAALPGPTPGSLTGLIDLIIQLILALLENKDKEAKPKPPDPDDIFSELRRIAAETATASIAPDILIRDIPKLVASIESVAARIPSPGYTTERTAREAMRRSNNDALTTSAVNWRLWNNAIRNELDHLDVDEHLQDLIDYKNAWLAIADALAHVRTHRLRPTT